jgi:hypothetical protein
MNKLLIVFAAGCFGGLMNSFTVWLFGKYGISAMLDVSIAPHLTPAWLYPRVVWGGIWGALFILPFLNNDKQWFIKGSLFSLAPTAVQLFYIFPEVAHKGMAGMDLGLLTPLLVVFFNWVWGVMTAYAIKISYKAY